MVEDTTYAPLYTSPVLYMIEFQNFRGLSMFVIMKHAKNFVLFIALQFFCGLYGFIVSAQTINGPIGSDPTSSDNSNSLVPAPWYGGSLDTERSTVPFELKNENSWISNDTGNEILAENLNRIIRDALRGSEEMILPSDEGPIFVTPQVPNVEPSTPQLQGDEKCTIEGRVSPEICCNVTGITREFFNVCKK